MEVYLNGNPQVTFGKNIYRRYTKFNCWKSSYTMESNIIDLTELVKDQTDPVMIKDMWIDLKTSNLSKDTNISFILVPKYEVEHEFLMGCDIFNKMEPPPRNVDFFDWIGIEEYFANLDEQIDEYNLKELEINQKVKKTLLNPNSSLEEILAKKNTLLLSKLTLQTAQLLNKYLQKTPTEYLNLPITTISMVLNLITKSKYKLVLHIDQVNEEPINLIIKYLKLQDLNESQRFNQMPHEYLVKRYVEVDAEVENQVNNLKCNFTNTPLAGIIIYSEKKLESVKIKDVDGHEYYLEETTTNPENSYSPTQGYYYILTQIDENLGYSWKIYQPLGSYTIGPNDPIKIKMLEPGNCKIKITYVIYDVLRYYQKNFVELVSYSKMYIRDFANASNEKFNELVDREEKLTKEQFAEYFYLWAFNLLKDKTTRLTEHFSMDILDNITLPSFAKYEQEHRILFPPPPLPPIDHDIDIRNMDMDMDMIDRFNRDIDMDMIDRFNRDMDIDMGMIDRPDQTFAKLNRLIGLNNSWVFELASGFIRLIENTTAVPKPLETGTICEVSLENIKCFESYYSCPTCSGNFKADIYRTWIEDHTKSGKCPKCQTKINTMPRLKINSRLNNLMLYGVSGCLLGLGLIGISKYL